MAELTKHQKRVLAAMRLLESGKASRRWWRTEYVGKYLRRYDIGCVVYGGRPSGVQLSTMAALMDLGYIEADNMAFVEAVAEERCTCGCDAWRLTKAGKELAETFKIAATVDRRDPANEY